jgi:Pterin 4 alpha carbinolamine dehydratase
MVACAYRRGMRQVAIDYFVRIASLAEGEGHHPDLQLTDYNCVDIALWTHKLGGITENDVIMAVKIDTLPIALSRSSRKAATDAIQAGMDEPGG